MDTASTMYTAPNDYNLLWESLMSPMTLGLLAMFALGFTIFIALFSKETASTLEHKERKSFFTSLEVSLAFTLLPLQILILISPMIIHDEFRSAQMENITAKYIVDNLEEIEMSENLFVAEYSTLLYPGPFKIEFNINEETGEPNAKFVKDEGAYPVEEIQNSILAEITRAK